VALFFCEVVTKPKRYPLTGDKFGYDYESMKATRTSLAEAWVI